MGDIREELGFRVLHFGVNCTDESGAKKEAETLLKLFGLPLRDGQNSIYAGPLVEFMKSLGRGKCGHIGLGTLDVPRAKEYLEGLGIEFDPGTARYDSEGRLYFIYLKNEIAGFAVHIMQS